MATTEKPEALFATHEEQSKSISHEDQLYVNIMTTNKPNPRGPGYLRLYVLVAVVLLCSTMNGFDSSLMGSINTLPNYTEYFGLPTSGNASTGIVFAIFQVCPVVIRVDDIQSRADQLEGRSDGWCTFHLDGRLVRPNLAYLLWLLGCLPCNCDHRPVDKPAYAYCRSIFPILFRDLRAYCGSSLPRRNCPSGVQRDNCRLVQHFLQRGMCMHAFESS